MASRSLVIGSTARAFHGRSRRSSQTAPRPTRPPTRMRPGGRPSRAPARARATVCGSRMSPSITSTSRTWSRLPRARLSRARTSAPPTTSFGTRFAPMKPHPPVTRIEFEIVSPLRRALVASEGRLLGRDGRVALSDEHALRHAGKDIGRLYARARLPRDDQRKGSAPRFSSAGRD